MRARGAIRTRACRQAGKKGWKGTMPGDDSKHGRMSKAGSAARGRAGEDGAAAALPAGPHLSMRGGCSMEAKCEGCSSRPSMESRTA